MKEVKPKRQPNKWQLFLKGCIPGQPKDLGMGEKVTACGTEYRILKEKDPTKLEEIVMQAREKRNNKVREDHG
jgi:hypothetical protein